MKGSFKSQAKKKKNQRYIYSIVSADLGSRWMDDMLKRKHGITLFAVVAICYIVVVVDSGWRHFTPS